MGYNRMYDANEITARFMDSILIEQRLIDSVVADTKFEIFGKTFDSPVMTPAFSHLQNFNGRELTGLEEYSAAANNCNILNFAGMVGNEMFKKMVDLCPNTVRIVKPYADEGKVKDHMAFAKEVGAAAIGMDIDHIFGENGYDVVDGEEMAPQTMEMLEYYVSEYDMPFVVKGVLSTSDAIKCADIGVDAIVVSHHHGRLPSAVPPLMVLPEIKDAILGIGSDMKIIVDCSIDSGVDVYKALALGADAAAVGRSMLKPLEEGGTPGVENFLRKVSGDLRYVMSFTGCEKLSEIDESALFYTGNIDM